MLWQRNHWEGSIEIHQSRSMQVVPGTSINAEGPRRMCLESTACDWKWLGLILFPEDFCRSRMLPAQSSEPGLHPSAPPAVTQTPRRKRDLSKWRWRNRQRVLQWTHNLPCSSPLPAPQDALNVSPWVSNPKQTCLENRTNVELSGFFVKEKHKLSSTFFPKGSLWSPDNFESIIGLLFDVLVLKLWSRAIWLHSWNQTL